MTLLNTCIHCSECKDVTLFPRSKVHKSGFSNVCTSCKNERQRNYRKSNSNSSTRRYEKTVEGYLMRTYRNMLSRVKGVLKKKRHLYEGLEILAKEEFYKWSKSDPDFIRLFIAYELEGYKASAAPSIDRIDSRKGYTPENIRWLSHSENSRLGALSRSMPSSCIQ